MKRFILLFFIFILVILTFFMFNRSNINSNKGETISLQDSTGTEVEMPIHPQKIIFLNASNLEIFTSIGGKAAGKINSTSYPSDIKEQIENIPEVGMIHAPNVEKIMSLKPDLVIGTQVPFHLMLRKPFAVAGIPLYVNMINSYEDVLNSIDLFGKLANKQDVAAKKRAEIERDYAELTKNTIPNSGPKTLIIFGSPDSFSMATNKSFSGDLLQKLGGRNITDAVSNGKDSSYLPISMEYLTKENPEVILLITMGNEAEVMQKLRKEMSSNSVWQDIDAVKNNQVYQLPANLFTVNPGTHIIESMKLMQKYLNNGGSNIAK